jgi:phosphoribosyl 1,2-cyclic phosphodiesterase
MEIVFMGTGGGRVNLLAQIRRTAGFWIKGSVNFYVDPGPGVLSVNREFGENPANADVLVVTHCHIDHVNDAALVLEAMSKYATGQGGVLVGSKSVLEGYSDFEKCISTYHQKKAGTVIVAEKNKAVVFGKEKKAVNAKMANAEKIESDDIALIFTPVKHDDPTGFGFVLQMDGKKIGYTSDTEYLPELGKIFAGCDYLIVNNLKPMDDDIPDHLSSGGTIELLKAAKPKLAILSHMGMKVLRKGPDIEAALIQKESGVKTIAAKDGMRLGDAPKKQKAPTLADFVDDEMHLGDRYLKGKK